MVDDLALDNVLELGTNTGMSGSYILSARRAPHLTTVEGSPDLCAVAEHALKEHDLFDDALDALAAEGKRFDAVFIDGQHEERAHRAPGAVSGYGGPVVARPGDHRLGHRAETSRRVGA